MLERVLYWERDLFFFLNGSDSPYLDSFMFLISNRLTWIILVFIFLFLLFRDPQKRKQSLLVLFAFVLLVLLCDQFSSHLIKPMFMRFRPTHHPDFKDLVDTVYNYRGGNYGFISGHATNIFGFSMLSSLIFNKRIYAFTIFLFAILMAYTRIYLGVHFITDIIPGIIAGLAFGVLTYYIYIFARKRLFKSKYEQSNLYTNKEIKTFIVLLIGYIVIIAISCSWIMESQIGQNLFL